MPDNRCPYYERRWWDLMVAGSPSDPCCKLQDTYDWWDHNLIDGICNSDDFRVCPFYLSKKTD